MPCDGVAGRASSVRRRMDNAFSMADWDRPGGDAVAEALIMPSGRAIVSGNPASDIRWSTWMMPDSACRMRRCGFREAGNGE